MFTHETIVVKATIVVFVAVIAYIRISHTTYKKMKVLLRLRNSSVNVTKSAVSCGFGHIN